MKHRLWAYSEAKENANIQSGISKDSVIIGLSIPIDMPIKSKLYSAHAFSVSR